MTSDSTQREMYEASGNTQSKMGNEIPKHGDDTQHDASNKTKRELSDQTRRVMSIMEAEKMNATQFCEAIGIQKAVMSHLTAGRNNPSADVIYKIIDRFETINARWLLSGKGSMRINDGNNDKVQSDGNYFAGKEPDLFNQPLQRSPDNSLPPTEKNIHNPIRSVGDKSDADEVNVSDNINKIIEKEVVVYKERPVKTIDKLLIFYSDNTYETFIPEK